MDDVIDDLSLPFPQTPRGTAWEMTSDQVMGGVSDGAVTREIVAGREALRLRGDVSLENNGGFVQMSLNLAPGGAEVDACGFAGIALWAYGNAEPYNLHLRTADVLRPWQSYRASFVAEAEWREVRVPFDRVEPYRVEAPFDARTLRRIGIVGIGRAFTADVAVRDLRFYA